MSNSNTNERTNLVLAVRTLAEELGANPGDALVLDENLLPVLQAAGGGSQPIQSGTTKPNGVVTPTGVGYLYIDTSVGAVYIAVGATDADWVSLGGLGSQEVAGLYLLSLAGSLGLFGGRADTPLTGGVVLSDAYTQYNGNSLGVKWEGNGTDGQQQMEVVLGSAAQFIFKFLANGALDLAQTSGVKFPTSDPHVAGAWWDDAGTLTKSSG